MNKRLIIYLIFAGLVSLFASCEKDQDKAVLSSSPVVPAFTEFPDLTLKRANANDVVTFKGTPIDPGFQASSTYYLEASAQGNNFEDALVIFSGPQDTLWKTTVGELNTILLRKFAADQVSSVDFRIRAVLVAVTGSNLAYSSQTKNTNITIYGLPRLDLISGASVVGKVESPAGNGVYSSFVKLDKSKPFTFKHPETNVVYGGTNKVLAINGAAITPGASGWHKVSANINDLSFDVEAFKIGLVGSATTNGWDGPDQEMDYDASSGTWKITTTLKDGAIKFRLNNNWDWNLGGTTDALTHNGADINVTAGNYTITLTITNAVSGSETGKYTIVKN
jgi:hypothetical protein